MADDPQQPVDPPQEPAPPATSGETAEQERARLIADAKARVEAGTPKTPVKKKVEGPKPVDASGHPLAQKVAVRFGATLIEASEFLGQLSLRIDPAEIVAVCTFLRDDAETPFNYLCDLTCVHYIDREAAPFEIVYQLTSLTTNTRVRLKAAVTEAGLDSVTSVWPAANWPEREVFDLFGVRFHGHPDLRRILLPPDWSGHPFRKEVALEFVENEWTETHLPEFTDIQQEQLDQRRAYGLEELSNIEEREMRRILQREKEVMQKDK
jgi:NADH-quinone oxidoreductase subunit C